MRFASPYAVVSGTLVAGLFVVRAASAVPAATASARGRAMVSAERYAEAVPLLDRAAIGGNLTGTLWSSGQARIQAWYRLPEKDRYGRIGDETLHAATEGFLTARAASPGSTFFVGALCDVYTLRARAERARRTVDLATLAAGPWAQIGDNGRIAIGLGRAAIEREPNRFDYRDRMVLLLETTGLHGEAMQAMEESARVLPDFAAHPDLDSDELTTDLVEAFWRTSRELKPEDAPALSRDRWLLASGQLGRRLGHLAEAEQDLRAALIVPSSKVVDSEEAFYLALVLVDLGRFEEAEVMLARADGEPVFGPGVASTRARMAESQQRWPEALAQLRVMRRLQPRELGVLLHFSNAAQKAGAWDEAEEALRWAILVRPESPDPRRAMVELLLAQNEKERARGALDDYAAAFGRTEDVARLEQALAGPLDAARH